MTPRDVIAKAITRSSGLAAVVMADDTIAALSAAGFVIVPRKAPAKWSRDHQQRWAGFLKAMLSASQEPDDGM